MSESKFQFGLKAKNSTQRKARTTVPSQCCHEKYKNTRLDVAHLLMYALSHSGVATSR